jgi:hypothetical protein
MNIAVGIYLVFLTLGAVAILTAWRMIKRHRQLHDWDREWQEYQRQIDKENRKNEDQ